MRRDQKKQPLRIDCHTHILPGMDDGAQDAEISVAMLQLSRAYGIESVLLTSHYYPSVESPESFLKRRDSALKLLRDTAKDVDLPRLIPAAEVRLGRDISALPSFERLCIGETAHLLLEMPYLPMDSWMVEEAENICYTHHCKLIFAHLPRYMAYYSDEDFEELLSLPDVIVQVNAGDMLFRPARKRVIKWMERGLPILFGSDCHNMDTRRPNLDKAAKHIAKSYHGISPASAANEIAADLGWL